MEHKGSALAYKRNLCAHLTRAAVAAFERALREPTLGPSPLFSTPARRVWNSLNRGMRAPRALCPPPSGLLLLPLFLNLIRSTVSNSDLAQVRSRNLSKS